MSEEKKNRWRYNDIIIFVALLIGVFLIGYYENFLLFHSIAELFSIIIACGIFVIAWNSRKFVSNSFFTWIGIAYLNIAFLDLLHTLAYDGMGVFDISGSNLATQLWVAARYYQAATLLIAPFMLKIKINPSYLFLICGLVTSVLILLITLEVFPVCYVDGIGLTSFKVTSEYIIIGILVVALGALFYYRSSFDKNVLVLLNLSIVFTIISEIAFTQYIGVYDLANQIGHIFKILAFFIMYKALIVTSLEKPFSTLFRDLKQSEEQLKQQSEDLEKSYSEFNQVFNASLPLRVIDKNCTIIDANNTYLSFFKVKREEIVGKKCFDVSTGHACDSEDCSMKQIESGKKEYEYELTSNLANGERVVSIIKSVPYYSTRGEFVGIIQNFTDITDRKLAEEALRESEDKYRTIAEQTSLGLLILQGGQIVYSNEALTDMTGFSKEEIMEWSQNRFLEKIHTDDRSQVIDQLTRKLDGDMDFASHYEIRIITKNSGLRWIELHSKAIIYQKNLAIFAVLIDITDKIVAQEKLEETELRYSSIFEQSPDGIILFDIDTQNAIEYNGKICQMLGYTREEFGKLSIQDVDVLTTSEDITELFRNVAKTGGTEFETKLVTKHRSVREFRITAKIVKSSGKDYMQAICRDITEEKRAQEKIEDIARFPLENPSPVIRVSESYVLFANKPAQLIFNIGEASRIPDSLKMYVEEAFHKNKAYNFEIEINNNAFTFVITPIKGSGYANIYGIDITDRKKAEEKLEQFVSTVSHELRTPISVLIMSLDHIEKYREKLSEEDRKNLREGIIRNVNMLNELVEDLLTLSRIDEEKITMEKKEYQPLKMVNASLELLKPIIESKNLTINIDIDENIRLRGNVARIDQIFRILVDNAVKYSNERGIIDIQAIDKYEGKFNSKGNDGVLFQIKDEGIGISDEDLSRIFERFFRSRDVRKISGTGLGLTIAKELVELHGGEIHVESEHGVGSTFWVFLPR